MITGYTFHVGDLFHIGHLSQVLECKEHCDYLIVGVLTDQAAAHYKRLPVIPYVWRAAIFEALKAVDKVVPQNSRDPTGNLKDLQPDILFHGEDWGEIPGTEWMKANGKKVIKTTYYHGLMSTSMSLEDIVARFHDDRDLSSGRVSAERPT